MHIWWRRRKTTTEYIEREKVIAKCKEIASCEWNHRVSPVSWADAYEQFADDVEDIPAADVVPRELLTEEVQKCAQINEGAVMLAKKLNDTLEELARYKDVAPVVRCKDCKHHQIMENKKSFMYWHNCKFWCADISEDDFCSYGERKDGEG